MPRIGAYDPSTSKAAYKPCADCPATIPIYGKKDRCAPCADAHAQRRKSERAKERRAAVRAHKGV